MPWQKNQSGNPKGKNDRRRKAEKRKVYSDVKSFGTRSAENSSGNNV